MLARRSSIFCSLALFGLIALAFIEQREPFAYVRLRNLYRDAISRAGRTAPARPDLVFLAIDAASVSLDPSDIDEVFGLSGENSDDVQTLRLMAQRWPWSRKIYPRILDRLLGAGARVVVFDLNFPGPTDDDADFRAALDRYRDKVVIGSNFVDGTLTRPSETLIPQTSPTDDRVAYTNFWADDDDTVRRARYATTFEQVREIEDRPGAEKFRSLAAVALGKAGFGASVPDDMDDRAMRFTGGPRSHFPARSLFEIFVPQFWRQNYQSGAFFRDKIVVVGAEGNWQHDEHQTPFGQMPGPELHLTAMNAALQREFVRELPPGMPTVFTFAAGVLAVLLSMTLRSPWTRLGSFVAVVAGAITAALVSFNYAATYLPMVAPMSEFIFTMLLGLLCDFAAERVEKTQLRRTFERYVSRDIVREMLSRPGAYMQSLGGMSKPVAVLFSDIRSYSAVTSTSRPDTLVAQLNEYFTAMVECVFECGGTLDKFIGDAVMAVWGTLKSAGPRQDAASAVRAALLMQKKLVNLNESWSQRGWPRLRIGIAINYGEVVVGNIGSPHRMEFTVIGETVNVSWKLQELTKRLNESLIIGASVAPLVNEHFETRFLGQFQLSGIDHPTEVFTVAEALRDTAPNIAANKFLAATSLPMAQPQITPPAGVSAELVTPSSTAEAR